MFGSLGMPELIFILVLALLIFGPKRLPQVGRTLGRGLREFRQATNELKRTVETEISSVDTEVMRPTPAPRPQTEQAAKAEATAVEARDAAAPEVESAELEVKSAESGAAADEAGEAATEVSSSRAD